MDKLVSQILDHVQAEAGKEHQLNEQILDDGNFQHIERAETKSIAFIDGGNAELLNGNTFCVQLIRTVCVIFAEGRKKTEKNEFYLFSAITNNDGLCFSSTVFTLTGEPLIDVKDLDLSLDDKSIAQGLRAPTANSIGGIARRFAELALAARVQQEVDFVVLDGNLEQTYTNEEKYLDKLAANVSGLAKTSTLFSKQGGNVAALLNRRQDAWQYNVDTTTSFVKLHPQAKHVFMLQGNNKVASALVSHCNDPLFLGYPYGLIYVDKMARISNHEKNILLTKLKVKFRDEYKAIEKYLNTASAHDLLDSIH